LFSSGYAGISTNIDKMLFFERLFAELFGALGKRTAGSDKQSI
jgi:hypothetical protein